MDAEARIRINRFASPVRSLGPGRRAVLWVQGCTLGCKGCASNDTWPLDGGEVWTLPRLAATIAGAMEQQDLDGLTISGGEPFQQPDVLADLVADLRTRGALHDRDVLLFTGYAPKRAQRLGLRLWESADAIVAGPYRADLPGDDWLRASSNQQLILNTPLAEERFVGPAGITHIQVTADGDDLLVTGLPQAGDLERFWLRMAERGIVFGETTWKK